MCSRRGHFHRLLTTFRASFYSFLNGLRKTAKMITSLASLTSLNLKHGVRIFSEGSSSFNFCHCWFNRKILETYSTRHVFFYSLKIFTCLFVCPFFAFFFNHSSGFLCWNTGWNFISFILIDFLRGIFLILDHWEKRLCFLRS